MSIIHVEGLSKVFDYYEKKQGLSGSFSNLFKRKKLQRTAVDNIGFDIEQGEIVGFLGPNGAGKTTTLKMLSGILFPTTGQAQVLGYTPWERKNEFKMQYTIVMGQRSQLWWDLPAVDSFYLNKCIYEVEDAAYRQTVGELAELLDVQDLLQVQIRRLSLGERMKMEMIASLIHRPKVIFLDEPTIGLDLISQQKLREFFRNYRSQYKATIILTSHYMNDIEDLCKRTIVINHGCLIYDGELSRVNALIGEQKRIKLKLERPVEAHELLPFGQVSQIDDQSLIIHADLAEVKQLSKMALDQLPIVDFTIEDVPVEEGIMRLYQTGR